MDYVIAVYRSRTVSIRAYRFLQGHGVTCALISTPRAVGVGCGLSVKFSKDALPRLRDALSQGETFAGFFLVRGNLSGTTVTRV